MSKFLVSLAQDSAHLLVKIDKYGNGSVHPKRTLESPYCQHKEGYPMKRVNNLYNTLISDKNLMKAIEEVNRTHHWKSGHKPNYVTAWVETTKEKRMEDLREIIIKGYEQKPPRVIKRYDQGARKWRIISEPLLWPDQYIHHALIQVLQPVMMRGMDKYCCGSIRGRGTHYAKESIERWMRKDIKGTRYCFSCDIRHFYDTLKPDVVLDRMKDLIKDRRTIDLIERITKDGIKIGAYPSQWFANTTLQPLDVLIRQSRLCTHYVRYMDNMTMFGSNKRNLRKLKGLVGKWLNTRGLEMKKDWQIFPVISEKFPKGRMPDAVGYRYGRDYTIPRKRNFLRIKRSVRRYRKKTARGQPVPAGMADSILSRLGTLKHCNNYHAYKTLFRGERIVRDLKNIARENRKEMITWSMFLEAGKEAAPHRTSSEQKERNIPTSPAV